MPEPRGEITLHLEDEVKDKSEHEQEIELDELGKEGYSRPIFRETGTDRAFFQEVDEIVSQLNLLSEQFEATSRLEKVESGYVENPLTQMIGTAPELSTNNEHVVRVHVELAQQPKKAVLYQRFKFLSWFFGFSAPAFIAIIISAVSIYYLKRQTDIFAQQLPLPQGLTEEQKAYIHMVVEMWVKEEQKTDDEIWESMAIYTDKWQPSVQGQIEFMSYLKDLSSKDPWTWQVRDQIAKVEELKNAYLSNKRFSDIYRTVKGMTYQQSGTSSPTRLPRFQAADLCDRALSDIYIIKQTQENQ